MGGGASGIVSFSFFVLGWSDDDWLMNIENLQSRIKVSLCVRERFGRECVDLEGDQDAAGFARSAIDEGGEHHTLLNMS